MLTAHSEHYCRFEKLSPPSNTSATEKPLHAPLATHIAKFVRTKPYVV